MKKIIIILLLMIPIVSYGVTLDEYNKAMVEVSKSAAATYGDEFIYSYFWGGTKDNPVNLKSSTTNKWLQRAREGKTSSGYLYGFKNDPGIQGSFTNKYAVYCETFVYLMVHHASGGVLNANDYEVIKLSEIKPGDLIRFKDGGAHIAVYISDNNDSDPKTIVVSHATNGKAHYQMITRTPYEARRVKASALAKLNDNLVTASYDFHDRMDDYPPIINDVKQVGTTEEIKLTATDFKHYDESPPNDLVEKENSGIIAYNITSSSTPPTTNWQSITKATYLEQKITIPKEGNWFVWVKDVGGNVANKPITVNKIERIINDKPEIKYSLSTDDFTKELTIAIDLLDQDNLKEYSFTDNPTPNYQTISQNNNYHQDEKITKNGTYYINVNDIYNNHSEQIIIINNIDNEEPIINNLYYQNNYIYINATDNLSGLDDNPYQYENNEWTNVQQFYVEENGTYHIKVKDKAGNIKEDTIEVKEIETTVPVSENFTMYYIIIGIIILIIAIIVIDIIRKKKR